jgi:hypothetical protein
MLNPNSTSGSLAHSEKSKVNHGNSKNLDALNDGFENDDVGVMSSDTLNNDLAIANKKNEKERDVPADKARVANPQSNNTQGNNPQAKPEKYDDLASSGT